ncbi:MAG: N-acetyl-gamma-glutamyl-phosphate reductase, partial [Deltaproteobacteria bacterium]
MIKAAILGGSGYTGFELLRILGNHPAVQVTTITSRQHKGCRVEEVFPGLNSILNLTFEDPANFRAYSKADIIFSALPHHASMEIAPDLLKKGKRVIDLSADFRLKNANIYEAWYGKHHIAEGLLKKAVYGLPELYRGKIKNAALIANPGCYPTGAILGLTPILKAGIIDTNTIIIDSKSGVSGAGRTASQDTSFTEVNEGFKAYKVGE